MIDWQGAERPDVLKEAVKTRMGIARYNEPDLDSKLADLANWYLSLNAEEVKFNSNLK